ncbi:MAG: endonuclease MutS2 [Ignavibacteriae bacterium]|nr:endonuclease MutS2 [Ignavibacteriota bacterium]
MNLGEIKTKLEFEKVISKIRKYANSELTDSVFENIPFYTEKFDLERELKKVNQIKELIEINSFPELTGLRDVRELLDKSKIKNSVILSDKFLWLLLFLKISRNVKQVISSVNKSNYDAYYLIAEQTNKLFYDKILERHIEMVIDEDGNVKDTASQNLKRIKHELKIKSDSLRKTLQKILKNVSEQELSRDDIVTLRDGRSVIPVKVENKRKVPGIIHSSSASGVTVFIEPQETTEINNEITELKYEERREIEKILTELTAEVSSYYDELRINCEILAELDFIYAKARYAVDVNGNIPEISNKDLFLVRAYHPVLLQTHNIKSVVPLDVELGNEYNTLVITGPNAGGKTVSLKTVGLLQLLFQSGILIPADSSSKLPIFRKIFISIGDEQSIENDLSSFSSHLKYIKEILSGCDSDSLVLIDEICSGTDPKLGGALSASILKYLSESDCKSIVTTHIGDLKSFAYNTDKIENASLEYDIETLSPNYKFITGVPGQSFTFEIAKKYKFPESILDFAKSLLDKDENNLEELIKELNENKQRYFELKTDFDEQNNRLRELIRSYESKLSDIKKKEREIINTAKSEAERIIEESKSKIDRAIKEVRENKDFKPKEIKERIESFVRKELKIEKNEDSESSEPVKAGDYVFIKDSHSPGLLVEVNKDNATVDLNGVVFKVKTKDLKKAGNINKNLAKFEGRHSNQVEIPYESTLDIRGIYSVEVFEKVDKFLQNANLNSIPVISIVHGKGTGRLRKEVNGILSRHKLVKSFRLGNWNEGDSGTTIVELK